MVSSVERGPLFVRAARTDFAFSAETFPCLDPTSAGQLYIAGGAILHMLGTASRYRGTSLAHARLLVVPATDQPSSLTASRRTRQAHRRYIVVS